MRQTRPTPSSQGGVLECATSLLAGLRRSGLRLAIVSNTHHAPMVHRFLADFGIAAADRISLRDPSDHLRFHIPQSQMIRTAIPGRRDQTLRQAILARSTKRPIERRDDATPPRTGGKVAARTEGRRGVPMYAIRLQDFRGRLRSVHRRDRTLSMGSSQRTTLAPCDVDPRKVGHQSDNETDAKWGLGTERAVCVSTDLSSGRHQRSARLCARRSVASQSTPSARRVLITR
jgi:hypothetical protein